MSANNSPPLDQRARSVESVRQLGVWWDEATLRTTLAHIARQKPKREVSPEPEPSKE